MIHPFVSLIMSSYNCPPACNQIACHNGVVSCSKPGLTSIPTILPANTVKVLLMNQDFSQAGDLNYLNISSYGPPKYKIAKITIQNSRLTGIASESFSHLNHLDTLDLSFNRILVVLPRTFESLNLKFLRLDGNIDLRLQCSSFQKSIIRHLSMINCSLRYLDYCTLKPIMGALRKLILSNNLLQTIDSKYNVLFQILVELRLNNNMFDCSNCRLSWLSKTLSQRYKSFNSSNARNVNIENIFPKCESPFYLNGKFIHEIDDKDLSCNDPSIKSIDLKIENIDRLILSCRSQSKTDHVMWYHNSKIENLNKEESNIVLYSGKVYHHLQCLINNRNGNISTKVNIGWPKFTPTEEAESTPSPSEEISSVTNIIHIPQFSLLELLGAIFGTFMAFFLIFVFVIRYILHRNENHYVQYPVIIDCNKYINKKSIADHQNLTINATYPECELMRYDVSSSTSFCNSQTYDVPVFPNSIFIDFKTHQQIHTT